MSPVSFLGRSQMWRLCDKNVYREKFLTDARIRAILSNRTRRYLSWIEDLTTNQGVIGSNPIRRTTNAQARRVFLAWPFC